jgi:5-methylthioribose kinase
MELTTDIALTELSSYLKKKGWINNLETVISIEIPGEGNMNRVLRAKTSNGSLILKQATTFVNKYPDIPAPIDRIDSEHRFYSLTGEVDSSQALFPHIIGYDRDKHLLVIEDLGKAVDYTYLYQKGQMPSEMEIRQLAAALKLLHGHPFTQDQIDTFPSNLALRKLNHQHIFEFPLMEENGFDLDTITPGLQDVAMKYKTDQNLKNLCKDLGSVYLGTGSHLLHGDYYPGSWLKTKTGIKVIDPEFCFFGPKEFDLGVVLAHMTMTQQSTYQKSLLLEEYGLPIDQALLRKFEGIEIIRRIIGLAQLPLDLTLEEKKELLKYAYHELTLDE